MYSRFHNIKDEINSNFLLIILDEGEGYFHPEWQRQYINMLIEYLPTTFSKCKSIQVVAASNSPFLVADLPKSNVIFLEQYMDSQQSVLSGICKVINGIDSKQTFAANIHGLLIDNFFLTSTIGEFADKKIKEIIKYVRSPEVDNISHEAIEDIRRNISIIAEPIIRKRLEELFVNRFSYDEKESNKYKVEQMLQEISKLNNKGNQNEIDSYNNLIEILQEKIQQLKNKDDIDD